MERMDREEMLESMLMERLCFLEKKMSEEYVERDEGQLQKKKEWEEFLKGLEEPGRKAIERYMDNRTYLEGKKQIDCYLAGIEDGIYLLKKLKVI